MYHQDIHDCIFSEFHWFLIYKADQHYYPNIVLSLDLWLHNRLPKFWGGIFFVLFVVVITLVDHKIFKIIFNPWIHFKISSSGQADNVLCKTTGPLWLTNPKNLERLTSSDRKGGHWYLGCFQFSVEVKYTTLGNVKPKQNELFIDCSTGFKCNIFH